MPPTTDDGGISRLSKPAKFAALAVIIATIASEVAVLVVYRDSADGQTPVVWGFMVIYGLLALFGVRLIDGIVRRLLRRHT